tara:strand:+ start:5668 stop:6090 length:423 start_codon:yes stop_codon:yes gene_type:complete
MTNKINFNNGKQVKVDLDSSDIENVNVNNQDPVKVSIGASGDTSISSNNPALEQVKLTKQEPIKVVLGTPSQNTFTVGVQGPQGPIGPTGPEPDFRVTKYLYGDVVPLDGRTGDKWFWITAGIEFTFLNGNWIQLYPNMK